MKSKQLTYLEKFNEAVKKHQGKRIKKFLAKFTNSLTDRAINNLSNTLASGNFKQRGWNYYQPHLQAALAAMKNEVYR